MVFGSPSVRACPAASARANPRKKPFKISGKLLRVISKYCRRRGIRYLWPSPPEKGRDAYMRPLQFHCKRILPLLTRRPETRCARRGVPRRDARASATRPVRFQSPQMRVRETSCSVEKCFFMASKAASFPLAVRFVTSSAQQMAAFSFSLNSSLSRQPSPSNRLIFSCAIP